jgi:hypothetical protein
LGKSGLLPGIFATQDVKGQGPEKHKILEKSFYLSGFSVFDGAHNITIGGANSTARKFVGYVRNGQWRCPSVGRPADFAAAEILWAAFG